MQRINIYATILLVAVLFAACQNKPKATQKQYQVLSQDAVENTYLTGILLSNNADSVAQCAQRDFKTGKYYWFGVPYYGATNSYFKTYAQKHYGIILIGYGDVTKPGQRAYNTAMGKLLTGIKMKPLEAIYQEAEKASRKVSAEDKKEKVQL